jgi:C4-type Zn-finger protein
MICPECTKPMTQQQCKTPINYAAEIRWEKWRCEACKLTGKVETIFSHDEGSANSI